MGMACSRLKRVLSFINLRQLRKRHPDGVLVRELCDRIKAPRFDRAFKDTELRYGENLAVFIGIFLGGRSHIGMATITNGKSSNG